MPTIQEPSAQSASDRLQELLAEAGAAPRTRPSPERRNELALALRAEILRLMPLVQAQADRLNHGTRAWYSRDKALGDAREELKTGLSPSSLAACLRLNTLARTARALDDFAGGETQAG